jgi:hypothetical protein
MARSPWLLSDPEFNGNFSRKWREPSWVLRLDKKWPAAASTANRPKSKTLNASDFNRNDRVSQARREAEAIFIRN